MSEKRADDAAAELVAGDDKVIGKALAWSLLVIGTAGAVICGVILWLNQSKPVVEVEVTSVKPPTIRHAASVEVPSIPLADVTIESGVDFVHTNGAHGLKLLPETMGGGCALFDYDNDGDPDLLLVNSNNWPDAPAKDPAPTMMLYRNISAGGKIRFENATEESGLGATFYGMGCAVGDYDGDGWEDVYITAVGENRLFHNDQGKFVDVTAQAGVAGDQGQWSSSAGFFDYDSDGDLDLFVCNYVNWTKDHDLAQDFTLKGGSRAYGPPFAFEGTFPYLFRNDGQGKFSEVAEASGLHVRGDNALAAPVGKSLGLCPIDLDSDGKIDIVVANDTVQNFVFHNEGQGKFLELASQIGVAFDSEGRARGAMGVDGADFRNDGTLAVAIGNFSTEMTALYVSLEKMQFADVSLATGLGPQTRLQLTFAVLFLDIDLDGRPDLLEANGHLEEDINKVLASQYYAQPPHLFWNCGPGQPAEFLRVTPDKCGEAFGVPMVGRGAAYADLDGDGDLDFVITASGARPRIIRNDQKLGHHWLRVRLQGAGENRDAIGAWVEAHNGSTVQRRQIMPTRGYLSQSELTATFGLGENDKVDLLVIHWPNGKSQKIANPEIDKLHVIDQSAKEP